MSLFNAVLAHSGGPTAVLNASLAGVTAACREWPELGALFGARHGPDGLLRGDLVNLTERPAELIEAIGLAPGSAIGSSRRSVVAEDCELLFRRLDEQKIRVLFYTGGNGSMGTALQIGEFARAQGYPLQVIGVPKTIDNDLGGTDHSPGYPSAARFFAHAARDIGEDNRALPSVCILETLGRNVGWIAATCSLARGREGDSPHLILFPERARSLDEIAGQVQKTWDRWGRCVVAVCEGQLDDRGQPFGADVDRPESATHRLASNLGHTLARVLAAKTGLRTRSEKPGLFGRSSATLASEIDREESYRCGRAAVAAARDGVSGFMVALQRVAADAYRCETALVPLHEVARLERKMPLEYISPEGWDVTPEFLRYAQPLVGAVETHARL